MSKGKTCGECKYFVLNVSGDCMSTDGQGDSGNDACSFFAPQVITNGDRIRSMSNEELTEFFALSFMCDGCPLKDVECIGDGETSRTYAHCYDKLISWLNAPAKEGRKDE